ARDDERGKPYETAAGRKTRGRQLAEEGKSISAAGPGGYGYFDRCRGRPNLAVVVTEKREKRRFQRFSQ
ncbi:MAG TPA: hypothetical protein VE055_03635, partial [Gaiellaceae bacterium]|nr:hypothetical protein [Gaiellaceae bacterium]